MTKVSAAQNVSQRENKTDNLKLSRLEFGDKSITNSALLTGYVVGCIMGSVGSSAFGARPNQSTNRQDIFDLNYYFTADSYLQ